MLCRITRASGGLRTVDIHCDSLHYFVASYRTGLYCTPCSHACREYAAWPWHPYACVTSGRCRWQGWWPGICRCCIGIEMAGDLALCCHGGERWGERTAGGLRVRTARVEGTAAGDVEPVRDLADNGERPRGRAPGRRGR